MNSSNVIEDILDSTDKSSKNILTPVLDDEQVDLNHILRIYQTIKKNLLKIIGVLIAFIFGLGVYMVYTTEFKNTTNSQLLKLTEEVKSLKKELSNVNKTCSINSNKVSNMQYRIETVQKFKTLEIEISNLKNITK